MAEKSDKAIASMVGIDYGKFSFSDGVDNFTNHDGRFYAITEQGTDDGTKTAISEMRWSDIYKQWQPKVIAFLDDLDSGKLKNTWKYWLYVLLSGGLGYLLQYLLGQ